MRLTLALVIVALLLAWPCRAQRDLSVPLANLWLVADSVVNSGEQMVVSLKITDSTAALGGFNFYIEFDDQAFVFDSATFGSLTAGNWEYLTARSGRMPAADSTSRSAFLRLVAIADQQDVKNHTPTPRSLVGPGELLKIYFYVSDRLQYRGETLPIRFYWGKCDDNTISDKSGHQLFAARSVIGVNEADDVPFHGPMGNCFSQRHNAPKRVIDFHQLHVRIRE